MTLDWAAVAAWVQAFGVLAAIGATWLISTGQDRADHQRQERADRAKIAAFLAILGACDECLDRAAAKVRYGKKAETRAKGFSAVNIEATADDFSACTERLASIPLFDLPDENLVRAVVHARLLMDTGKRRVGMVREQLAASQTPDKDFAGLLKQLRQRLEVAGYEVVQPGKTVSKTA